MFRNHISATVFTNEPAEGFFNKRIPRAEFSGDVSFVSTLRAMVFPRLKEDERVDLSFSFSSFSAKRADSVLYSLKSCVESALTVSSDFVESREYSLRIHDFTSPTKDDNDAWMERISQDFTLAYPEWQKINKVTDFYRGAKFDVTCFINPTLKSSIVFVSNMDVLRMHLLQTGIAIFLPWFFVDDNKIIQEEREFLGSFNEKTSDKYIGWLNRFAEAYDFRSMFIRQSLSGFESICEQRECDKEKSEIQNCINQINYYNSQVASYIASKRNHELRVLGLEAKIRQSKESDSELMEYFLGCKNLYLKRVNGLEIEFCVKNYLTYYDEDFTENLINNWDSYIYYPHGYSMAEYIPEDDMKRLMTAIFIDKTLRMQLCATFRFNANGVVSVLGNYAFDSEFNDCIPNPHYYFHDCMGENSGEINARLRDSDYIGALAQCVTACGSINMSESVTVAPFIEYLCGYKEGINLRCIELPTGELATPKEAIDYLKREETENG